METVYYFLASVVMFMSIPATVAIIVMLYEQRPEKTDYIKISFITWTLTNPFGAIALSLLAYYITILSTINWKIEDLTKVDYTAKLLVPTLIAGILAISSFIFKNTQDLSEMNIITELDKRAKERDEESKKYFQAQLDKSDENAKLAAQQAAQQSAQQAAQFQQSLDRIDQRHTETLRLLTGDVTELRLEQAYQKGKSEK
jgi:hypothetical protein